MQNRVALVTGGGRGIGRAVCQRFLDDGFDIVAIGRQREPLEAIAAGVEDRVAWTQLDVAKPGDPERAVALAVERFGRLDVLVNNAGVFFKGALADTSDDDIARMLDVNVRGVLALCRQAIDELAKTNGCIINISSAAAHYVRADLSAYGASKAAVDHLTKILAVELGSKNIRVNAVAPGMTRTDMTAHLLDDEKARDFLIANTALRRVGEPDDVAAAVAMLASDDARWITGQIIAASGGLLL